MSEADKMFEKLGYTNQTIFFNKKTCECVFTNYNKETPKCIRFHKDRTIDGIGKEVTMNELQAINKKCEELNWI